MMLDSQFGKLNNKKDYRVIWSLDTLKRECVTIKLNLVTRKYRFSKTCVCVTKYETAAQPHSTVLSGYCLVCSYINKPFNP